MLKPHQTFVIVYNCSLLGYQGSRMQKMYADLYADIKHKNELGYALRIHTI